MKTIKKNTSSKSLRFLVMIYATDTGYSADAPDVLGCVAAAKTLKGVRGLMAEALGLHLEMLQESGEAIPVPRTSIEFAVDESSEEEFCTWVEVSAPDSGSPRASR